MKKIISLLFIVSIAIAACGANETATVTPEPIEETPAVESSPTQTPAVETASRLEVDEEALNGVEVIVWTPWYGTEQSLFETFAREFNESNQWGIKITAQSQINFTNLYETVTASLPTAEKPDLVIALPEHAQEWYADGVSPDMTPYTNDPLYGINTQDIPAVFWDQDMAGDIRVAIPAQRTANVLLWNQSWAKELGFNSAPANSADFQKQSCGAHESLRTDEFVENDALGGWIVNTEGMTALSWMQAFDGGVLEEGNYRFLSPKNIEAFTFLRNLSEESCTWVSTGDPITSFAKREALFITTNLQDLPLVARAFVGAENRDEWVVLPFPNGENGVLAMYGSSYALLNSSPEEQLASWLFVRWLLDNEQDARWVEATHLFPLRDSTLSLLGDYEMTHPQWKQAVDLIPQGRMQPQLSSWRTVKVVLADGFAHMYRVGIPSGQVAAVLAQMDTLANELNK